MGREIGESVWVIEQGEHTGCGVVGAYTKAEHAEAFAAMINEDLTDDEATVAEWPLNPGLDALNQGLTRCHVRMLRDGTVEGVRRPSDDYHWNAGYLIPPLFLSLESPPLVMHASVWAKDKQHAIKIANEKRLQMIASGEWEEQDASS